MKIEQGTCIYCGQIQQIEVEDGVYLTEEDLNRRATSSCTCTEAKRHRKEPRHNGYNF